tara:strand:- start:54 stop:896 length:843 start_codon:yes stop_codon:yes gene_type:complete
MKNIIGLLLLLFFACGQDNNDVKPLARVFDKHLYLHQIPSFESDFSEDSLLYINNFVNEWAMQNLLIYKAEFNFKKDPFYIDSLVNVYRESLLIHYYKQALVQTYLDTVIHDSLIANYHNSNIDNFKLKENIIKLNYIKIRNVAPNLDYVQTKYHSIDSEDIEELKNYCVQFAERFVLEDSSWVSWSDFVKQIPYENNPMKSIEHKIIKKNQKFELEDNNYKYFIFIKDFRLKGTPSPLEYVSSIIRKILINKRKKDILHSIEDKLIEEAIINNNFEIYE